MAVTTTTRFGVTRWSAGTDPFSRAQMDSSHAQVEALGAIYGQGTLAARPASTVAGRYYTVRGDGTAANNGRVFYDDGTTWWEVGANVQNAVSRASAAASVAQVVQGFAGQTAKLQEWRTSAGAVVGSVGPAGQVVFGAGTFTNVDVAALTASGAVTLAATLVVSGSSTFYTNLTVNGTLIASTFKSTATRPSGLPKTELNSDGTGRMDALIPPGFYMCSLRTDVPAGWLRMEGQTVNTATYPDLHLALGQPGGAGAATFVVPDWRDRTTVGVSGTKALGSTGGSASATLTVNELPSHLHSIAHTHTMAHTHNYGHTHEFPHTHTINHDHAAFTSGSTDTNHVHTYVREGFTGIGYVIGGTGALVASGSSYEPGTNGMNTNQTHTHSVDVPAFTGTSGGASTTTTASQSNTDTGNASNATTSAPSTGNSGSAGSGGSFSIQNPYGAGYWVIKT